MFSVWRHLSQFPTGEIVWIRAERERSGICVPIWMHRSSDLFTRDATGFYPAWSADGKELAYVFRQRF